MSRRLTCSLVLALAVAAGCEDSKSTNGDGGVTDGGAAGGGAGVAGAVGTAGTGGTSPVAACGIVEPEPNDDRDHTTPYTAGSSVVGCISAPSDKDYYDVTVPSTDLAGGYFDGSLTSIGDGNIKVQVYSTTDNGLVLSDTYSTTAGASIFFWWAGAPGAKYHVVVSSWISADKAFKYTLKANYVKIDDAFEPNDTKEQAKPLTLGTTANGFFYAGFKSQRIEADAFDDWFSVTLAKGDVTAKLEDVATDILGDVQLFDSTGKEIAHKYNTTAGASVTLNENIETAGAHWLKVGVFAGAPDSAYGPLPDKLADHFKRKYKLTVTQP